jgi:hypothetical protein
LNIEEDEAQKISKNTKETEKSPLKQNNFNMSWLLSFPPEAKTIKSSKSY